MDHQQSPAQQQTKISQLYLNIYHLNIFSSVVISGKSTSITLA